MVITFAVLVLAICTAVMQSSLDRAGVGRIESAPASGSSTVLVMLSVPITWLSNLGLIVIAVWSLFALPWLPALGVVASTFIVFSLIWSAVLAALRRGRNWFSVVAVGIPLLFVLRLVCAACVVYLGISYAHGAR